MNRKYTMDSKGIWVLIERHNEKLLDGSLELVGEGRRIADKLNNVMTAVVMDPGLSDQFDLLAQHGAARILNVEHSALNHYSVEIYSSVLANLINKYLPDVILSVNSINGEDLASRLAARLETGLVTACDRVDVNGEGQLVVAKPIYDGMASANFVFSSSRPQMATINFDALELKTPDKKAITEVFSVKADIRTGGPRTRTVGFLKGDPRALDLTEAEIVIAGGKGLGSQSNFELVYDLADILGGTVGASRRAVDEAWISSEKQIGMTGKTVRPKLFISCGISGASQHTMGMKDSKLILAINKDRNAPIFEIADVGVLGDVQEILPELITRLQDVMKPESISDEDEPEYIDSDSGG